jgi:hypothetical protein
VLCNFAQNVPDLQPLAPGADKSLLTARVKTPQLLGPVGSAVWSADASARFELNAKCQDFVTRYLGRSLMVPNDPNMCHVNRRLLKMAFAVSYICSLCASY